MKKRKKMKERKKTKKRPRKKTQSHIILLQADKLASHCSQLISSNWAHFTPGDFAALGAELVHTMLQVLLLLFYLIILIVNLIGILPKERAPHPLHSAISLRREDVVFLHLIQHHRDLPVLLNAPDSEGRCPALLPFLTFLPSLPFLPFLTFLPCQASSGPRPRAGRAGDCCQSGGARG